MAEEEAWRPAGVLSPEQVALVNRLVRRRTRLQGAGFELAPCAPPAAVEEPEGIPFRLRGSPAVLEAQRPLVDMVLATLDPAAPAATGEARRLLLELALEEALAALDPVLPVEPPGEAEADGATVAVGLECRAGQDAWTLRLLLGMGAAQALAEAWEALPAVRQLPAGVGVLVHLRLGCCTLSAAEVRLLRPGDVLLPEQGDGTAMLAVVGERLVWQARRDGRDTVVESPRRGAAEAGVEEWTMGKGVPPDAAGITDAALDELPVRLVFEAGRMELPLGELGAIGPGHVFTLPGGPAGRLDILANGRRIGQGELVQVGDGAGVRLLSLTGRPSGQG